MAIVRFRSGFMLQTGGLKVFAPSSAKTVDKAGEGYLVDSLFETTVMKQNPKSKYCGPIAAMDALLHHVNPWVRQLLPNMIRQVAKQTYAVKFPGNHNLVRVPLKDLKPSMIYQQYLDEYGCRETRAIPVPLLDEGALGAKILLVALAKQAQEKEPLWRQKKIALHIRHNPEEALAAFTGGIPFWRNTQGAIRLCRDSLQGDKSFAQEIKVQRSQHKAKAYRRQLYSELNQYGLQPHRYVLVAVTPENNRNLQRVINAHANAIRRIDVRTQTVTIADPMDTSKPIVLSYDEFLERYTGFGGVDLSSMAAARRSV